MLTQAIYSSSNNPKNTSLNDSAIVVLPEIYGLNAHTRLVVDRCAQEFNLPAYGLDFFSALNHQVNDWDYVSGKDQAMDLLRQYTGKIFLNFWDQALAEIKLRQPQIKNLIVMGFCFGGSLALLSAIKPEVKRVISFYGGQSLKPFIQDQTILDYLSEHRSGGGSLKILAFYGEQDHLISEADREKIKHHLSQIGDYTGVVLPAGHAFFNSHRPSFNAQAADAAWQYLIDWMK